MEFQKSTNNKKYWNELWKIKGHFELVLAKVKISLHHQSNISNEYTKIEEIL